LVFDEFFPKITPFKRRCGKMWYSQTVQRWQYNTVHTFCMLDNWGKNTGTHSDYLIHIAFQWQQLFHECSSVVWYMYIAFLVYQLAQKHYCTCHKFKEFVHPLHLNLPYFIKWLKCWFPSSEQVVHLPKILVNAQENTY
jgi:hypothetical protein